MELELAFDDLETAKIILKALKPETTSSPSERASVDLNLKNEKLNIDIKATDVTSLRAAVNSYLRWITLSFNILSLKNP